MLCDDCHRNEACIHITQISPEGKMDKNLCEECAARYQNFTMSPDAREFTVNDFLKGLFRQPPEQKEEKTAGGLVCPNCGMTFQDFAHTGKIGCSVCYNTFRAQLAPLLKRIHGSSTHSGKIPRRSGGVLVVRHEIAMLKEQLAEAVQSEAYEKAAEYRDKIRELERKIAAEEKGGEADGRA
jgi:protein arginine kinase activator